MYELKCYNIILRLNILPTSAGFYLFFFKASKTFDAHSFEKWPQSWQVLPPHPPPWFFLKQILPAKIISPWKL